MQHDESRESYQVGPSQKTVGLEALGEQKSKHADDPDVCRERIQEQCLLREVLPGGEYDVAAFGFDGAHQLSEEKLVLDVQDQVWKEDDKGCDAADPYPFVE